MDALYKATTLIVIFYLYIFSNYRIAFLIAIFPAFLGMLWFFEFECSISSIRLPYNFLAIFRLGCHLIAYVKYVAFMLHLLTFSARLVSIELIIKITTSINRSCWKLFLLLFPETFCISSTVEYVNPKKESNGFACSCVW